MRRWAFFIFPVSALAILDRTHGVPPKDIHRYTQKVDGTQSLWTCTDGSKTIPLASLNDDYCDCPDGSDEPGTSACADTKFYCRNDGHVGAYISSSRVGDGLCENDCCDGSDEPAGVCNNTCAMVGKLHQEKLMVQRKLQKTGSRIRSSYITFAQKEKKRLESEISALEIDVNQGEANVLRLKDLVNRLESLTESAMEQKRQSPLFQSLMDHHRTLKLLRREYKEHLAREKALGEILGSLRSSYNPNYQDMAVLEAVRGWEHFAGLPHINDVKKDGEVGDEDSAESDESDDEEPDGELWTPEQLEAEIDILLGLDHDTLLVEHEKHMGLTSPSSSGWGSYLPHNLFGHFEAIQTAVLTSLAQVGLAQPQLDEKSNDVGRARKTLEDADRNVKQLAGQLEGARTNFDRLFKPEWFGREGEWKKLDGLCLDKDAGDYTYEVCLFDEARQKPNHGGTTFSLGRFAAWNDNANIPIGSAAYYGKQYYTQGTKCWNGPSRSVELVLSCGTENTLVSVSELEKCEYQFTVTTPALCLPPDLNGHQEL